MSRHALITPSIEDVRQALKIHLSPLPSQRDLAAYWSLASSTQILSSCAPRELLSSLRFAPLVLLDSQARLVSRFQTSR
jgi:hypothetical protein